jgi:hypothetical protein
MIKAVEEKEIQEEICEDYDVEWEYEEKTKSLNVQEIKNRPREFTYETKEETFLWAYETIFNWLGNIFDRNHK